MLTAAIGAFMPNIPLACIAGIMTVGLGMAIGNFINYSHFFAINELLESGSVRWHGIQLLVGGLGGFLGQRLLSDLRSRRQRENHNT